MVRIDPLTYDGRFDTEFYASESYSEIKKKVLWYITEEGFMNKPDTYFINIYNHYWQIEITEN